MLKRYVYEQQVKDLLDRAGISSPPVSVEKIAGELKIKIQKSPLPDELSGLLIRRKDASQPIIGVNILHVRVRQRFTIAHELGHYLLHKGGVHVDRNFAVRFRDSQSGKAKQKPEIEANRWAAELLMPTRFLKQDMDKPTLNMGDEDLVNFLAKRYEVSIQAMAIRLANLGYIE